MPPIITKNITTTIPIHINGGKFKIPLNNQRKTKTPIIAINLFLNIIPRNVNAAAIMVADAGIAANTTGATII